MFGFSTGWAARRHSCQTPLGAALEAGFKEVALLLAHGTEVTDARLMRMCMRDSLLKTVPFLLENGVCARAWTCGVYAVYCLHFMVVAMLAGQCSCMHDVH